MIVRRALLALLLVAWIGEPSLELDSYLYAGLWRSPLEVFAPLFAPLPVIRMFTWQLLLIALVPFCLLVPGATRNRSREMDAAIMVSLACIGLTFLWGWIRDGGPYQSYYQLWRFLCALLVAVLLACVIRTPRDLRALAMTVIFAALVRGTLVIYFYWFHVRGKLNPAPDYMTTHDDSLLFVTAIVAAGSWAVVRGGRAAWFVASAVSLYLLYAIVLNDRRIAWVELAIAMIAVYVLIGPSPLRRRINRWAIFAAPVALAYIVAGWGSESPLFAPIHALASAGSGEDSSSLARQEEVRNLLHTLNVAGNPLLGTGWGFPYQQLTTIYNRYPADWVLAFHTPHNSLLGLAVFSGLVGLLGIWGVVPVAAYLAARGYKHATDPTRRTAAIVAVAIVSAYGVHSYGDIGFQSLQCGLILSVALATSSKLGAWSTTAAGAKTARTPGESPVGVPLPAPMGRRSVGPRGPARLQRLRSEGGTSDTTRPRRTIS